MLKFFEQLGIGTHCSVPVCKVVDHTVLASQIVMAVPLQTKSVWVGFLYILVVRVPSVCGVNSVSRNGMEPSGLFSSTVNMMKGSTELMCCKNSSLFDLLYDQSVIYISFPYPRRVHSCCYGPVFK